MRVTEHISALQAEGELLAVAAAKAGPEAAVPTCPEWVVRDLIRHLGGVHRWATGVVAEARVEPWTVGLEEVVGTWPVDADLIEWFRSGLTTLVDTLAGAAPDLTCWAFLPAPSPLAFWARRQALETAIHRIDAERAAVITSTPFAPDLAADGVDELLSGFLTRRGGRLRADPARSLEIRCTDTADVWHLDINADGTRTSRTGQGAECRVSGPASDLFETVWNRRAVDGLAIDGDEAVLQLFVDAVRI